MLLLLLTKMRLLFWKNRLIVWVLVWANVLLTIKDWNLYFTRNKFHTFMYIPHEIHIHILRTMTIYMLECTFTHCYHKGYLTKFCYDRLNILNVNVWLCSNTKPQGPKKVWVPKGTLTLFDAGVFFIKTWDSWRLDGYNDPKFRLPAVVWVWTSEPL